MFHKTVSQSLLNLIFFECCNKFLSRIVVLNHLNVLALHILKLDVLETADFIKNVPASTWTKQKNYNSFLVRCIWT